MQHQLKITFTILIILFHCSLFAEDLCDKTEVNITKNEKESDGTKLYTPVAEGASAKKNFIIQPTLNIGHHIGFGSLNYAGTTYGNGLLLGMTLNLDYNVHDYVSIGAYYSFAQKNYKTTNVAYLGNAFGARIALHWWQLLADKTGKELLAERLDFDVHAHIGAFLVSFKDKTLDAKTKKVGLNAGGGIALRYYFVDHFGVAIEAGYEEASWAKIGFAVKI
ncbi:MAG: hypothetical protein U0U67_11770 [Chitinophagales bacterium]